MAETQGQMTGTGSIDSDLGQEPGPQIVTEADIAAEVGKKDSPRENPVSEESNKLSKDIQKVQQEQSARRQLQEKLEGKVDNLADMFERFMTSRNEQQPASALTPDATSATPSNSPNEVVKSAFEDVDMLDGDAVQEAISKIANSIQGDQSLRHELDVLKGTVKDMGGHIQKDQASQYWQDFRTEHNLSEDALSKIRENAHSEIAEMGWYERGSEGYEGAFHANVLSQAKSGSGRRSSSSGSARVSTAGTDVVPNGASARTGIPVGGDDGIPLTPPEALWRPDND